MVCMRAFICTYVISVCVVLNNCKKNCSFLSEAKASDGCHVNIKSNSARLRNIYSFSMVFDGTMNF